MEKHVKVSQLNVRNMYDRLLRIKEYVDEHRVLGIDEIKKKFKGSAVLYTFLNSHNILQKKNGYYFFNQNIPVTKPLATTLCKMVSNYNTKYKSSTTFDANKEQKAQKEILFNKSLADRNYERLKRIKELLNEDMNLDRRQLAKLVGGATSFYSVLFDEGVIYRKENSMYCEWNNNISVTQELAERLTNLYQSKSQKKRSESKELKPDTKLQPLDNPTEIEAPIDIDGIEVTKESVLNNLGRLKRLKMLVTENDLTSIKAIKNQIRGAAVFFNLLNAKNILVKEGRIYRFNDNILVTEKLATTLTKMVRQTSIAYGEKSTHKGELKKAIAPKQDIHTTVDKNNKDELALTNLERIKKIKEALSMYNDLTRGKLTKMIGGSVELYTILLNKGIIVRLPNGIRNGYYCRWNESVKVNTILAKLITKEMRFLTNGSNPTPKNENVVNSEDDYNFAGNLDNAIDISNEANSPNNQTPPPVLDTPIEKEKVLSIEWEGETYTLPESIANAMQRVIKSHNVLEEEVNKMKKWEEGKKKLVTNKGVFHIEEPVSKHIAGLTDKIEELKRQNEKLTNLSLDKPSEPNIPDVDMCYIVIGNNPHLIPNEVKHYIDGIISDNDRLRKGVPFAIEEDYRNPLEKSIAEGVIPPPLPAEESFFNEVNEKPKQKKSSKYEISILWGAFRKTIKN